MFLPGSYEMPSSSDGIEWRERGEKFWFLEMGDVDSVQALASGVQRYGFEGKHGALAYSPGNMLEFDKELDIALNLVYHPN